MKKLLLLVSLFILPMLAQAQQPLTFQVATPWNCGRASTPLYCYGVDTTIPGGSFWIDTHVDGYYKGTGFILFFGQLAELGEATVTSDTTVLNAGGQVAQLTTTFQGTDNNGAPYTGTMTLEFTYYKGGYGRAAGVYFICTGGVAQITYA